MPFVRCPHYQIFNRLPRFNAASICRSFLKSKFIFVNLCKAYGRLSIGWPNSRALIYVALARRNILEHASIALPGQDFRDKMKRLMS
jgi:hypothetical protein